MIGLDTNILVRYFTQDEPAQSRRATRIIESLTEEEPGFISLVVMVETVWVLRRVYRLSSKQIAQSIERMLQADTFAVQNEQQVFTAMTALKTGVGSFSDALIAALGVWAGCAVTVTFDREAAKLKGFAPAGFR
ncbi:MAG TPA: type II toxin-antitoxin system VapC family toxin [Silvibacterium sp.]|nr:type II toxin-antitoxin system VapC family toxin [Silvibacterium sp.]